MSSSVEPILATAELPGIGGRFKARPEDFEVVERPLYEPEGEGEHLYLETRRSGLNTRDLVRRLARLGGLHERDVGYAGLKDRQAVSTQTFSLAIRPAAEEGFLAEVGACPDFELLSARRHRNKLGRGHLLGNRFRIRVRDLDAGIDPEARAERILERLVRHGLPNYFGAQRYGRDGDNADRGEALLRGGRERDRFLRQLYLHAWQSRLFDRWLGERLRRGDWATVLEGDVARIEGRGGLFLVEDRALEAARAARGEISATGPMYGGKLMSAAGEALEVERAVAPPEAFDLALLRSQRLPGSRRAARIFPTEIEVETEADGSVLLGFFLPKGSYATVVLREVMKPAADAVVALPERDD